MDQYLSFFIAKLPNRWINTYHLSWKIFLFSFLNKKSAFCEDITNILSFNLKFHTELSAKNKLIITYWASRMLSYNHHWTNKHAPFAGHYSQLDPVPANPLHEGLYVLKSPAVSTSTTYKRKNCALSHSFNIYKQMSSFGYEHCQIILLITVTICWNYAFTNKYITFYCMSLIQ